MGGFFSGLIFVLEVVNFSHRESQFFEQHPRARTHTPNMASSEAGSAKRSAKEIDDAAQRKKSKQSRVLGVLSTADLAKVRAASRCAA